VGSLYINKLEDIDLRVLKGMMEGIINSGMFGNDAIAVRRLAARVDSRSLT
jgi:hypothetical protein